MRPKDEWDRNKGNDDMLTSARNPDDLVYRLRRVLSSAQLDCQCRGTLEDALERFSTLEARRRARNGLQHARSQRDRIASLLFLLGELDDVTEHELDPTVFAELALIFDDIASAAAAASRALREVGPSPPSGAHGSAAG